MQILSYKISAVYLSLFYLMDGIYVLSTWNRHTLKSLINVMLMSINEWILDLSDASIDGKCWAKSVSIWVFWKCKFLSAGKKVLFEKYYLQLHILTLRKN